MQGYPDDGGSNLDATSIVLGCILWLLGVTLAIFITAQIFRNCATYDPGVGQSSEQHPPRPPAQAASSPVPASDREQADAGFSSGQVAQAATSGHGIANREPPVANWTDAGASPALATLTDYELDPGAEPTWQGLYAMTVEQWSDPEFLHDAYALPTAGDCQIALTDDAVVLALQNVCAYDLVLVQLGAIPRVRHTAQTRALIDGALRERRNSMAALMGRLDEVSLYKNWSLLDRLYMEWATGD